MKKLIKNLKDNLIEVDVLDYSDISVLDAGYIITLDGDFIKVRDTDDHGSVFSNYLNQYTEIQNPVITDVMTATSDLTDLNHIVYLGIKTEDLSTVYGKNKGNSRGFGVIILPDNYEDVLTEEQKEAIRTLLETNKSVFGTGEKIGIEFHTISDAVDITPEQAKSFFYGGKSRQ